MYTTGHNLCMLSGQLFRGDRFGEDHIENMNKVKKLLFIAGIKFKVKSNCIDIFIPEEKMEQYADVLNICGIVKGKYIKHEYRSLLQ